MSIVISNSKAKTYRRCPKLYEWKYVRKLSPRKKAIQLERGTWLHDLLMHHYDGHNWRQRHDELTREFNQVPVEITEELGDLPAECQRIMESYIARWHEEDRGFITVDSELDEVLPLPNGDSFRFIIDLVVEERGRGLWLVDHKTVGKFMDPDFMMLDAQLARYFWAAEKMGYKPLLGVMFNELITKAPTQPQLLKSGALSKRMNIVCDSGTYYQAIIDNGLDPEDYTDILQHLAARDDRFFRRTRLPRDRKLTKQLMFELVMTCEEIKTAERRGWFPRSPDKSCTYCDFLTPCQIELFGGDADQVLKFNYESRRKGDD